ncbi:hypothetical protein EPUS_04928 [Endocarpon pusillum Z07020]|uniref:IgE-binding protein n=1 Tax=Endocarpon pusillum (strain Z07020 / HMAS-L-300199) TaxID=1263415 RepID=U1HZ02_ENDPU|nr:uncharacterized protein EPUS_04928 [Endocarpon pusillum Z07020]ERF74759.1 hypothetical protein EPUS_04928 [Endocarpon pusillum Z07020]
MHLLIFLNSALLLVAFAAAVPTKTTTCTEEPAATTSSAAISSPSIPYSVVSVRSGSPIHLLSMQARNQNFYLGGLPGAYCPQPPLSSCPSGFDTIFAGLGGLSALVPGGQAIYARSDGSFGFTQAHSARYPAGALIGGYLTYSKTDGAQFGSLGTHAFGATGFMACPTEDQGYQVFAAVGNATAPEGDLAACLGFDALTVDETDLERGAWQYI